MEKDQIEFITRNLPELVEKTIANTALLNYLLSKATLSKYDIELIELKKPAEDQSTQLYNVLTKRKNGYQILKNALSYTGQSGALELLEKCSSGVSCKCVGPITYDPSVPLASGKPWIQVFMGRMKHHGAIAVKQILRNQQNAEEFQRELIVFKKLPSHSNIVQCFHAEIESDKLLIALELCSYTLRDCVQGGTYPIARMDILKQATEGLRFLHDNNIIHRDLKPSNILLKVEINLYALVKLSDFDMSKILEDSYQDTSQVVGSPGYAAPEMLRYKDTLMKSSTESFRRTSQTTKIVNAPVTRALDIFSLGCVFYYVLADGQHPFGSGVASDYNVLNSNHNISESEFVDGGGVYQSLIEIMISKNSQNRPCCKQILETIRLRETEQCLDSHAQALEKAITKLDKEVNQMFGKNKLYECHVLEEILDTKCAILKKSMEAPSVTCDGATALFLREREKYQLEQLVRKFTLINKARFDLKECMNLESQLCLEEYQTMMELLFPSIPTDQELLTYHTTLSSSLLANLGRRYASKCEDFTVPLLDAVNIQIQEKFQMFQSKLEFASRTTKHDPPPSMSETKVQHFAKILDNVSTIGLQSQLSTSASHISNSKNSHISLVDEEHNDDQNETPRTPMGHSSRITMDRVLVKNYKEVPGTKKKATPPTINETKDLLVQRFAKTRDNGSTIGLKSQQSTSALHLSNSVTSSPERLPRSISPDAIMQGKNFQTKTKPTNQPGFLTRLKQTVSYPLRLISSSDDDIGHFETTESTRKFGRPTRP